MAKKAVAWDPSISGGDDGAGGRGVKRKNKPVPEGVEVDVRQRRFKKKKSKPAVIAPSTGKARLEFTGSANFRARIVCSVLSGKALKISEIRSDAEEPGLTDYEVSFLRLVDKVTDGTAIQINETGTSVKLRPGLLTGGFGLEHECPVSRSVGYFLEGVLALAPFGRKALTITFKGITNDVDDMSADLLRVAAIPLLKKFGLNSDTLIKLKKRGAAPKGGGEVFLRCDPVPQLKPQQLLDEGLMKRIRGVAYTTRCSPAFANRMVEAARGVLNNFIPDVYIFTDHYKGKDSGFSPGYGLALVAESTTGAMLTAEITSGGTDSATKQLPEDLGKLGAQMLCEEIAKRGCVDSSLAWLALLLMVLCPEDVSKIRLGTLNTHTIGALRTYREFFGTTFKIVPDTETKTVILSCLGSGFKNYSRKTI